MLVRMPGTGTDRSSGNARLSQAGPVEPQFKPRGSQLRRVAQKPYGRCHVCVVPLALVEVSKVSSKQEYCSHPPARLSAGSSSVHLHLHHLVWSCVSHLVIVAIRLSRCLLLCQVRLKVGVVEGSLGRDTPCWVIHQHHLEQF